MVVGMDFLSFWTCLGSVFIPICYLFTCPTYFHAVTSTRVLHWMRRYEERIHGRVIHSMRYKLRRRAGVTPKSKLKAKKVTLSPRVQVRS